MAHARGLFVAFEGNEGAGKTTVVAAIAEKLAKKGVEVVVTREPGSTPLGERIRELLLQSNLSQPLKISHKAELLLFLAARAQNLDEVIIPALKRGACVLCDRFNDSTIAYQGWARGIGLKEVEKLCQFVCEDTLPDLTFFLSVDPRLGLERARRLGAFDRMESEAAEFHARVQDGFHQIDALHPDHFTFIDAGQNVDSVIESVWNKITAKL